MTNPPLWAHALVLAGFIALALIALAAAEILTRLIQYLRTRRKDTP